MSILTGTTLFNQPEINSIDQYAWRNQRTTLVNRVKLFCKKNNLTIELRNLSESVIQQASSTVIIHLRLFDIVSEYADWVKLNQYCEQQGKKIVVITDNLLEFKQLSCIEFFSYYKLLGATATTYPILTPDAPSKLFNCFIQRVCPVRQSWFYFLHHYNLLDKGYVSLLMKQLQTTSTLSGVELFDDIHTRYQLDQLPHFNKAYHELREKIPYRNFVEVNDLLPLILDSKYSLVLETYALEDDTNRWCFTEKSLRTLQFPSVPLLFIQKQGISKLRSIGFEFNSVADHVDLLPWTSRQQSLLEILVNDSVNPSLNTLIEQCQHNRQLLQRWQDEYHRDNFFDDAYSKALS